MIQAIVTDIEGTTTDIRFVHQVLFPYARERLTPFCLNINRMTILPGRWRICATNWRSQMLILKR